MSDKNLLADLLVKITGDLSGLKKALEESKKESEKTSEGIKGTFKKQFKEIDDILGGFGSKAIKLLKNPLVLATTAIIGVGKAFSDTVTSLANYGDMLSDTSAQTGISTKRLQEYKYVAEQNGATLDTITNALKLMTRGLDTNSETFAQLGVQTKDSNGNFRDSNDIFDETIAALGGVANETERSKLALQLFGRDATSIVPILKLGATGLKDLKDEAHKLGLVMSDEAIKNAGEFKDSTEALKAAWKGYTMSLVQDSIPALLGITEALKKAVEKTNELHRVSAFQKTYDQYKLGKGSVVDYHDAIVELIASNEKLMGSEWRGSDQQRLATQSLKYLKQDLEAIMPAYEKYEMAIDKVKKAKEDMAAAEQRQTDATIKAAQDQLAAAEQSVRDETFAYQGAINERKANYVAYYAKLAADKAASDALIVESDNTTTRQLEANAKKIADGWVATGEEIQNALGTGIKDSLESLGEALVNNEDAWGSLGKIALNTLVGVLEAIAAQLAAMAVVDAVALNIPGAIAAGAGATAALIAAGAAGAYANSLATGGIATDPTLALVGDNRRFDEVVMPLSPDVFAGMAEGILGALASRSRPAGITPSSAGFGNGATVSSGNETHLHIGTLIADDAGLRNLNRTLRKYGIQENVRVGA